MGPPPEAPGAGAGAAVPDWLSRARLHAEAEEEHEDNLVLSEALKGFSGLALCGGVVGGVKPADGGHGTSWWKS